ncbi:MAG: type IV pilus biogenesis protein PilC [Planctomycetaceae bacterium]|jgi:general secretion pathway protein F/type IV pilus assembly protein PilC|nr:pilus assembly protein PilC [Planctomycetaceae bacterium]GIS63556.1 MAG: type IV pilus biogenesis protein PilC [Planctomycetaceae bacterium]|tara:strand:- start:2202 stop:3422 length:1221 start_codon:yes stop_codon:yes gene_type:complete
MPEFQYIARELTGREVTGVLTAATQAEAASSLSGRSLFPLSIALAEEEQRQQKYAGRKVKPRLLATFFSQLADLLRSGVPLLRSLDLLDRQTKVGSLKLVLSDVRDQVADGTPLAASLGRHPRAFNALVVSMVRAGEEGGFLEDVLKRIAIFTDHQEDLKGRVLGAIAYPAFLVVTGFTVVTVMIVWFVPKFEPIFDRLSKQGELPWATTTLLGISGFLQTPLAGGILQVWMLMVGGLLLAGFGFVAWARTETGRWITDRLRLKLGVMRSLATARFCRILGTLLHNGVPILNSLRIAKDASGNMVLAGAINTAADSVQEGKTLAGPLGGSGEFADEIVEMIAVGEESNNLEQVLINISDNLERRTYRQLELGVRFLEPLMLMVIAGVILFVVAALLLPVFQSAGTI